MSSQPFSILKRFATKGQWVVLTIEGASGQTIEKGMLLEIDETGVVLQTEDRLLYEPASDIRKFEIIRTPAATEKFPDASTPVAPESSSPQANESLGGIAADSRIGIPGYAFEPFSGDVVPHIPEPTFTIDGLEADDRQDLVRWKNKYDYAVKVKELSRARDILPAMRRWAERLDRPEGYSLCASLAAKIDDMNTARELFGQAADLADPSAIRSLAYLDATQERWEDAAKRFIQSFLLRDGETTGDRDALIALGRCLRRLDNRCVQGLAVVNEKLDSTDSQRIASTLIAYALAVEYHEAAQAALSGDIDLARALASGAPVFAQPPTPISRTRRQVPAPGVRVQTPETSNRFARVAAYSPAPRAPRQSSSRRIPLDII